MKVTAALNLPEIKQCALGGGQLLEASGEPLGVLLINQLLVWTGSETHCNGLRERLSGFSTLMVAKHVASH